MKAEQTKPRATLKMRVNSPRYGSCCALCKGRVRVGREFVVDPVNSDEILHVGCFLLRQRRR